MPDFSAYSRIIRPIKESNGKMTGKGSKKIGNPSLKWAVSEATVQMLKYGEPLKNCMKN